MRLGDSITSPRGFRSRARIALPGRPYPIKPKSTPVARCCPDVPERYSCSALDAMPPAFPYTPLGKRLRPPASTHQNSSMYSSTLKVNHAPIEQPATPIDPPPEPVAKHQLRLADRRRSTPRQNSSCRLRHLVRRQPTKIIDDSFGALRHQTFRGQSRLLLSSPPPTGGSGLDHAQRWPRSDSRHHTDRSPVTTSCGELRRLRLQASTATNNGLTHPRRRPYRCANSITHPKGH